MTKKLVSHLFRTNIIPAALALSFLYGGPSDAAEGPGRFEGVTLVEFFDTESDQQQDKFFKILKEIAVFSFQREVKQAPFVAKFNYLEKAEIQSESEDIAKAAEMIARETGNRYYITGSFIRAGDNVVIRTIWKDFVSNGSNTERLPLGPREIADFEIVEKKVGYFAQSVLKRMYLGVVSGSVQMARTLLVSCFGTAGDENAFRLGQIIVSEMPFYLQNALLRKGIARDILAIRGLNYKEYFMACKEGTPDMLERLFQEYNYRISGSILSHKDRFEVRPSFIDPTLVIPIPMQPIAGSYDIDSVANFVRHVAELIGDSLLLIMVQQRLRHAGLYEGVIDGILGARTATAIRNFQSQKNLRPTGQLDSLTIKSLLISP